MSTIFLSAIILVICVIIIAVAMLKQSNQKQNRYLRRQSRKTSQDHQEPKLSTIQLITKNDDSKNTVDNKLKNQNESSKKATTDADEVLGIKTLELESRWQSFSKNTSENDQKMETSESSTNTQQQPKQDVKATAKQSIVVLNVLAEADRPYGGYELLQSLLSAGLRYGNMNIFHRFEQKTGRGETLFSVASVTKPGTFDLQKMGAFSCKGLTLFFVMDKVREPLHVFELLLETAGQLVEGLGGKVYDSKYKLLTRDKVIAMRKQIRQFECSQHTADLFAQEYVEVNPT